MKKNFEDQYKNLDTDGDGVVDSEELSRAERIEQMLIQEEKAESQRRMAGISLAALVGFPFLFFLPFISDARLETIASMADLYVLSLASIVGFHFGATAWSKGR